MVFIEKNSFIRKEPGFNSLALVIVILVLSVGVLLFAFSQQRSAPTVDSDANDGSGASQVEVGTSTTLPYSEPVSITIASVGINSELIQVGKAASGMLEVPNGNNYNKAAWYKGSPAPGQAGASIIIGHVDSNESGPSIFFELGNVKQEDTIAVDRQDGTKVKFQVYKVRQYDRQNFPTKQVYIADSNSPELRLITCGGDFSPTNGMYESNVVVYARKIE